jgi:hypothetical protein
MMVDLLVSKSDPVGPLGTPTCQTERERGGVGKAHDRPPLIDCHTVNRAT